MTEAESLMRGRRGSVTHFATITGMGPAREIIARMNIGIGIRSMCGIMKTMERGATKGLWKGVTEAEEAEEAEVRLEGLALVMVVTRATMTITATVTMTATVILT